MNFSVVIPARYASSRLPAKPLADIGGKPMIQWVYEQAQQSGAAQVIIATDDERIATVARSFGAKVCITRADHQSGTERLAEVVQQCQFKPDDIIVNVQGDEPLIPPVIIRQVAQNLTKTSAPMATLAVKIDDAAEMFNPNVVKVVTDAHDHALYFSRAPIPWDRAHFAAPAPAHLHHDVKRHIGLYAYRAGFIAQYVNWPISPLEQIEALEQLRVLYQGEKIHVEIALEAPPLGVDTQDDLDAVRQLVANLS